MQRDIKLINGNLPTTYIYLLSAEKMELGDGPLEKLWNGGGGEGGRNFFRYQIACMNFV